MCVAAASPTTSVVEPPPSATSEPSRPIRSVVQSRSRTAAVFAASPAGTSCCSTSRAPRATCALIPWIPETCASATSSTGPSPGNEVPQLVDRADLDVDAAGGEQCPVDVAGVRVRDLLVQRLTLAVERVEGVRVLRERAIAAGDALPRDLGLDVEQHA